MPIHNPSGLGYLLPFTIGDILYADSTSTLAKLAAVASGSVLVSAGAGVAPAWSTSPSLTAITLGAQGGGFVTETRATIQPPSHTTGPWLVTATDSVSTARLAILYNTTRVLTLQHDGKVLIGADTGTVLTSPLSVKGNLKLFDISSTSSYIDSDDSWGDKWHFSGTSCIASMDLGSTAWQFNVAGGGVTKYRFNSTKTGTISGPLLDILLTGNATFYGSVGVGGVTPTAILHLKAGTATASTAPLKFNSGTVLTSPEAGAVEFNTDDFFATITTGTARKGLVLDDGTRLSSGKIPVATTNGRLIDLTASAAYTVANVTTDRTYDANATTLDELADVVGTIISDLQTKGILG